MTCTINNKRNVQVHLTVKEEGLTVSLGGGLIERGKGVGVSGEKLGGEERLAGEIKRREISSKVLSTLY